jgi:hypothetical protein
MSYQEWKWLFGVVKQSLKGDESAKGALGPPNSVGYLCGTCGGVVVTVVYGGTAQPQIRLRPGSKGPQQSSDRASVV